MMILAIPLPLMGMVIHFLLEDMVNQLSNTTGAYRAMNGERYDEFITKLILSGTTRISKDLSSRYHLHQNYPNTFNPKTFIEFDFAMRSSIRLAVYDFLGCDVKVLLNG